MTVKKYTITIFGKYDITNSNFKLMKTESVFDFKSIVLKDNDLFLVLKRNKNDVQQIILNSSLCKVLYKTYKMITLIMGYIVV